MDVAHTGSVSLPRLPPSTDALLSRPHTAEFLLSQVESAVVVVETDGRFGAPHENAKRQFRRRAKLPAGNAVIFRRVWWDAWHGHGDKANNGSKY
jgi:hypothetical protein